jgi:hypothetical protein
VDTGLTLSTPEWTTMSGNGLSLNQRYRIGCSLNVASQVGSCGEWSA